MPKHMTEELEAGARAACVQAGEYIYENGWTQFSYVRHDGSACALGALSETDSGGHDWMYAQRLLAAHVAGLSVEDIGEATMGQVEAFNVISAWNDNPSRTAEDVILALKEVGHGGEKAAG